MRQQTRKTVTYGKSRSGSTQNVTDKKSEISAPQVSNRARKDPKVTAESIRSNNPIPSLENEPGKPNNIDACKSTAPYTVSQCASDTRHSESGEPDTPRRKRPKSNRTATATPVEGHSLHRSPQASGVGTAYDLGGSSGDSQDAVNCQLQTKNNITPLHKRDTRDQASRKALGFDHSLITPSVRRAPTKREFPLKRKSPAVSHTIGTERLKDSPSTAGNHQKTTRTRKRLVDSLVPSDDSTVEGNPVSARDKRPGSSNRRHRSSSESKVDHSGDTSFADIPRQPSLTSSMLRGSRVTYARQRSFLNDISFLDSLSDGKPVAPLESHDLSQSRSSALHLQLLHGVDDEDSDKIDSKPVRSIHELRQAGENARFRETVEFILEDIEGSSNSVSDRCDGYVRLCIKLLEPRLVRQFCECGFEERLMESTTDNLDIISASLALCAYSLIFKSGFFPFALSSRFWQKIMQISLQPLGSEINFLCLVDRQSTSISKSVRLTLRKNLPPILSAVCEQQLSTTSPCFLALSGVNLFLLHLRQKVRSVEPISTPLLTQLISLLITINPEEESTTQKFEISALVLSILDSYTVLSSGPWDHSQCNSFGLLSRLRWLLYPNQFDQNRKILGLYIRVIMNITNTDPALCKELATPELVAGLVGIVTAELRHVPDDSAAKENSSLNIVILALGALTNLAEKNESSRAVFLMSERNSTSFFQLLLQQFSYGTNSLEQAHSVSEVQKNVVVGYLSILLATLCLNEEILSQLQKTLDNGLTLILSTTEEFLQYHQKIEQDSFPREGRDDGGAGLSTRLEQIISGLRQLDAYRQ
ncbi:hypothetical protein P170DRAFT_376894 [Aspergillus steynii IBT 23096]|uniref:Wings apart-like protein C-terminal domain-containing protein n=1 Tax=Aspergillus steynii IBT 23096 TaxID=1392250 RepID=A0A2I2GFX2_9EURO|nr:uncharacterized protein P170DRAFT_376894 [Aspergillus steynii IBT 23096]PLB51772.1 hypothetical protein P170DRAFT_376894 [Aspergillus steynii IBT 23096]